ncbi:ATP synthase mitochondrial F1 complex assembly factor 1 [Cylas formicarius]|uniref:ATP synthase mitochondrial F1 complex assembly factor 1 n=1 Tax=Cylas formicarius TaxID=197179 RepID=UPI00295867CF|nr:ATP synthase mitochondrial F1 complex assembly factor 1 [Cylas formicarius]
MHLTSFMRSVLYRGSFALSKKLTQKNIMTTPRKLQEILEDLKGNPYYEKYAEKITELQKNAPEEFSSRVVDMGKSKTKKLEEIKGQQFSQLLNPKKKLAPEVSQTQEEHLDKIMKVDLIKNKSKEEIKEIWEEYHQTKNCIAAVIPSENFKTLEENCVKYPMFLFPLPRTQGYEFIMLQFEKRTAHFTPLLYYQVHNENAPECLTITHYEDFKESKGIVLMRGEYDKNIINAKEAQCLANQLQLYYTQDDKQKQKLLDTFTHHPDTFDHMDLVKEISNISLK